MKKVITNLALVVAFLFVENANAQNNYFDNNPTWVVSSWDGSNQPLITESEYMNYANGDTIINSRTYNKIYTYGYRYNFYTNNSNTYIDNIQDSSLSAFLRDSANKIFGCFPSNYTDTLIFDFNLNVGDTVPLSYVNNDAQGFPIVASIDSFPVSNFYRKRFKLSSNYSFGNFNTYLYEGIGSNFGLFGCWCPGVAFEGGEGLCYSLNDTSYYLIPGNLPPTTPGCKVNVGIKEIQNLKYQINIYPNPATTLLSIHQSMPTPNEQLIITDIMGTEVYKEKLTGIDNTISISTWSAGIYFYEVRGTEGSVRGKFVVQK